MNRRFFAFLCALSVALWMSPVGSAEGMKQSAMKEGKESAKVSLSPHSVMIETQLQTALTEIKGLRTQLNAVEKPTPEMVGHLKAYSKEIGADLKSAMIHEGELKTGAKMFPEVAQSSDFKSVSSSLAEVDKVHKDWQSKSGMTDYWSNRTQVLADLDMFEKRLDSAIEKTKSFNSSQLEIASIG